MTQNGGYFTIYDSPRHIVLNNFTQGDKHEGGGGCLSRKAARFASLCAAVGAWFPWLRTSVARQRTCIPFKGAFYNLQFIKVSCLSYLYKCPPSSSPPCPNSSSRRHYSLTFASLTFAREWQRGFLLLLLHLPQIHPTAFLFRDLICVLTCYVCLYFCDSRVGSGWPHRSHGKRLQKTTLKNLEPAKRLPTTGDQG